MPINHCFTVQYATASVIYRHLLIFLCMSQNKFLYNLPEELNMIPLSFDSALMHEMLDTDGKMKPGIRLAS